MAKMKTEFSLRSGANFKDSRAIIVSRSKNTAVRFDSSDKTIGWVQGKDLERFAVNILKALKSNKLK